MGLSLACHVLLRLSHSHFRDAMKSDFTHLQAALRLIVLPLIATFDSQLHAHLISSGIDEPYFCLSWVITWFTHDIRDTDLVKRIFDFFIASHPLMVVYTSVAMVLHPLNRLEVLSAECGDFACVHGALADLPRNSSNVGWKYLPSSEVGGGREGGGYVTGNDDDDDDDSASYDPSLQDTSINTDDGNDDDNDGNSRGRQPRVPFQELIDLSISLM